MHTHVEDIPLDAKIPGQHPRFAFQADVDNHVFEAKGLLGIEKFGAPRTTTRPQYAAYSFGQFVDAKYVLVVTPGEVIWPAVEGTTFEPGSAPMRAVFVEIDTARPQGGFETVARNSDKVLVRGDRADDQVIREFMAEAGKAVVKGIEQRWPGAKTPWGIRTW